MSGNASRKYKNYMLAKEREKLFGKMNIKDACGITDYVPYSVGNGTITIGKMVYEKK